MNSVKLFLLSAIIGVLPIVAQGQNSTSKIAITPLVCKAIDLPHDAQRALNMKLTQMATMNGFGSKAGEFILTANVRTIDKQVTATAPAQYIIDLEVSAYVVNVNEKIIVAECSFNVKGIDNNENKAKIRAVNQIMPKTPIVSKFMSTAREKITDYYAQRVPIILAKAQSLASKEEYEQALVELARVPEAVEEYPMVIEKMTDFYIKKLNKQASSFIQTAKAYIATKDYENALSALVLIDPASDKFGQASQLIAQIKKAIKIEEKKELEAQLEAITYQRQQAEKQYADEVEIKKLQIEASKAVALKQAEVNTELQQELLQAVLTNWLFAN